nr:diguanylate cyclase [Bacilli bacterium]
KTILYVGNAFFLAEIVLLIVNIFVPILFEVDMQTGAYQPYKARNIMLHVQILMYFAVLVYTAVIALRRKTPYRRRFWTICFYAIVMSSAISVQIYHPNLPIYSIGCIVGSTLLNFYLIGDIKEEYKAALEQTREEASHNVAELNETRIIAYTDPLTGMRSKHAYVEEEYRIDKLIAHDEMENFAVLVFDLNGLKHVNDTKGHDAGATTTPTPRYSPARTKSCTHGKTPSKSSVRNKLPFRNHNVCFLLSSVRASWTKTISLPSWLGSSATAMASPSLVVAKKRMVGPSTKNPMRSSSVSLPFPAR